MSRRTRKELEAENELLLAELEAIRDQIDDLLDVEESDDQGADDDPRGKRRRGNHGRCRQQR